MTILSGTVQTGSLGIKLVTPPCVSTAMTGPTLPLTPPRFSRDEERQFAACARPSQRQPIVMGPILPYLQAGVRLPDDSLNELVEVAIFEEGPAIGMSLAHARLVGLALARPDLPDFAIHVLERLRAYGSRFADPVRQSLAMIPQQERLTAIAAAIHQAYPDLAESLPVP